MFRLALIVVSGGYSPAAVLWLLTVVASLVAKHGLKGARALGGTGSSSQLWHSGLVAPWHVGSSQTRDQTSVCLFPSPPPLSVSHYGRLLSELSTSFHFLDMLQLAQK